MITKEKLLQIALLILIVMVLILGALLLFKKMNGSEQTVAVITQKNEQIAPKKIAIVGEGEPNSERAKPEDVLKAISGSTQKSTDYLTILFWMAVIATLFLARHKIKKFINDIFEKSA